jgi:hypothetical protein
MKRLIALFIFIGLGSLSAQSFVKNFNVIQNEFQVRNSADTLRILAVMVEFQPDKYDGTIGTGKFGSHYTQAYGDTILDPLPHDANYFSDHLEFAKNYFKKVSNGKVNISYKVLPNVITVSKYIRDYVPDYKSKDLTRLGNFAKEVWQLADQSNPTLKFSDYELFIIFHAGVSSGLDIGTFSIDRNMPSLYLSNKTLKEIFGNQFNGFPVNKNSSLIKNSIILPETESRELTAIDGSKRLLEITINGALVSNIASHLGLPDLYNTETGTSAIGRFGLMDGQAIIANFGMFPPEPSPWEKMFLGWEVPETISVGNKRVNLSTKLTSTLNDTTLIKIPINSSEYFLIENRSQDAKKDKVKITYRKAGKTFTKIVEPDTSGYYNIDYSSIDGGVVIDVDEYDAAIPGNGIVIWHIDEKIINQKISTNSINVDLYKKGVDVEEADGIQDIGEIFSSVLGTAIGEGGFNDFWFKGNKSKLYKNRFSHDTKPNSNSNDGSISLITIENFSDKSNKMSFDIKFSSGKLELLAKVNIKTLSSPQSLVSYKWIRGGLPDKYLISIQNNSDLITYTSDGDFVSRIFNFSDYEVTLGSDSQITTVLGVKGKLLHSAYQGYIWQRIVELPSIASTKAFFLKNGNKSVVLVGSLNGEVITIKYDYILGENVVDPIKVNKIANEPVKQIVAHEDYFAAITSKSLVDFNGKHINLPDSTIMFSVFKNNEAKFYYIVLTKGNNFYVIENGKILYSFKINTNMEIRDFSLANIRRDGNFSILISNDKNLEAYSLTGTLEENFPIRVTDKNKIISSPLTLDINNDGNIEIIVTTDAGNIVCIEPNNKKPILFSLSFSYKPLILPQLFNYDINKEYRSTENVAAMIAMDDEKSLFIWKISADSLLSSWSSKYFNFSNNAFLNIPKNITASPDFFPASKAYNWPNPVYGDNTNIRYFVSENSDVSIKIFDLSGSMITEIKNRAVGGFDNETTWDVTDVQSGIYYARLEIKSDSGKTANKLIKIAVIK